MRSNIFTTAFRSLMRNKAHTLLNMIGLTLGMTCCLMVFLIIRYELSFDTFHTKADRIYRITTNILGEGSDMLGCAPYPLGEAVKDFPEVEESATVNFFNNGIIKLDNKVYRETGMGFVSPAFFELFDYEWITGNPQQSLTDPYSVVLTESVARRLLGVNEANVHDQLGRVINIENGDYKLTGIMKDFPDNTDFPFKILLSSSTANAIGGSLFTDWVSVSWSVHHYILLKEGADASQTEAKFPALIKKNMTPDEASMRVYRLQPLKDLHFDARLGNYNGRTTTETTIYSLSAVGLFLLLIACINFINLATAQSTRRSKEVGVRKILGAGKYLLIRRFMGETLFLTVVSLLLTVALGHFLFPAIMKILDLRMAENWISDPLVPLFLLAITVVVTFLAGFYPALVLSGFQPMQALANHTSTTKWLGGLSLRRGLIVVQFVISLVLIIGTLVVVRQLNFFQSQPLGFSKEAIVMIQMPDVPHIQKKAFQGQLEQIAGIKDVSLAGNSPSSGSNWRGAFNFPGSGVPFIPVVMRPADQTYIQTFGLSLVAGRDLRDSDSAWHQVVVNETLLRLMKINDPEAAIGKTITVFDSNSQIVGVVKDFHALSLREDLTPVLIFNDPRGAQMAAIKMASTDFRTTLSQIESIFNRQFPASIFEYQFMDQTIASFYEAEKKLSRLVSIFSGIAIFISCLGLFGLISFIALQRKKEIGVRKVNGATALELMVMLNKDFMVWVLIAFVMACPIAWFFTHKWLENFAYKTDLSWWIFALAGLMAIVIALLTVSWQSWKAATRNPVEALRYE
ncbi:MAG: ABC transporter permease [Verrucomicrobia bacterium]|nr:ABC transporter permease [Prolixibacteraceae bacterium]